VSFGKEILIVVMPNLNSYPTVETLKVGSSISLSRMLNTILRAIPWLWVIEAPFLDKFWKGNHCRHFTGVPVVV
jgi:hypothetical protein